MKKKLWFVNHYALQESNRSSKFARFLGKEDYDVKLFCCSFSHKNKQETESYGIFSFTKTKNKDNYEKVCIKSPAYHKNNIWRIINHFIFGLIFFLKGLLTREKPDVICASIQHFFTGLAAWLLAKLKRRPFVLEVRDLWPETLIGLNKIESDSFVARVMYFIERFLYRRADHIVTLLPRGDEYISGLGISEKKITYIPNGIIVDEFEQHKKNNTLPKNIEKKLTNNKLKLIYTGAIGIPNKISILVDAMKILNKKGYEDELSCFIFGDGVKRKKLEDRVSLQNITNVNFMGFIEYKYIPSILDKGDILIGKLSFTPVHRFGTSLNKLFDYLAAKKEIVFASKPEIEPFGGVKNINFIEGDDPKELANKIIEVKDKLKKNKSNCKDGLKYLKKNHSYEVLTQKYENVFNEVC